MFISTRPGKTVRPLKARARGRLLSGARWLLDTLLPPLCPGCDTELASTRWLCLSCRRRFRRVPSGNICIPCRRAERPEGARDAGYGCRHSDHREWGRAAYWMEPPLDRLIHAFKYGGRSDLARPLGRLMLGALPNPDVDLILPIPLHPVRRRERGYNQAELLARELSVGWGVPLVPDLLKRARATHPQARIAEGERAENVAGAFEVAVPSWGEGRSVLIVDDVVTTGETTGAAVAALQEAGAKDVVSVSLALA